MAHEMATEGLFLLQRKKDDKPELSSATQAAIEAVDAAAKQLPDIEIDLMEEGNFGGGGGDNPPPNAGQKVCPKQ